MKWLENFLKTNDEAADWEEPLTMESDVEKWIATFTNLMNKAHATAVEKGWWQGDRPDTEAIGLIGSEASEALEFMRKDNQKSDKIVEFLGAEEGLADIIIRVWDTCAKRGYELADGLLDILDPTGEGIEMDEDWIIGYNQAAQMMFERGETVGTHTSFATDIAAMYPLLGDLYDLSLEDTSNRVMGDHYADLLAHVLAMSGKYNLNVANAVIAKMEYNKSRPFRHGGKKF